jgi:tripartite-type tricarboxylate transporter receptor subunit TctC
MKRMRVKACVGAVGTAVLAGATASSAHAQSLAQSPAEFFAGKSVRIIIPFDVAGTYGQYGQIAAQFLRNHLPGNPAVIVQVMQGAGGVVALNHVANVAPKDGTVVIMPAINMVQDALLNPLAKYGVTSFDWLGRMMELVQLALANEKSGVTSLADAKVRAVSSGGSGTTNPTVMSWHVLNLMAGTKFNVVSGYKGLPDSQLAWERGEIDAVMVNWETVVERFMEPVATGRMKVLFAFAGRPLPETKGYPLIGDFGTTAIEKAFLKMYTVSADLGRTFALAKGVPSDRLAAWRTAFDALLADKEMRAELERRRMRFDPLNGAEVEKLVLAASQHSPETMAGIRAIFDKVAGANK